MLTVLVEVPQPPNVSVRVEVTEEPAVRVTLGGL